MVFDLTNFFYWASGILVTIFFSYKGFKFMKTIKNTKINQNAKILKDSKGIDLQLVDGEDLHIQDMEINQNAETMDGVTGLSVTVSGKQAARLQGLRVKQPQAEIIISDDPNVNVTINKQT